MSNGASIVALPSLSSSLHALPHATSIHNVHIHQHMSAQRAAESKAKLQKAISKTAEAALQNQHPACLPPSPSSSTSSDGSIFITKTKTKLMAS